MKYKISSFSKRLKVLFLILTVLVLALALVVIAYFHSLSPVSSSFQKSYFRVELGTSVNQIASNLKEDGLIRSGTAFEIYTRVHHLTRLQAGTYTLSPSLDVPEIVSKMVKGDVAKDLFTILPGKRIDQIKEAFKKTGYPDVQIEAALNPATYSGHPALSSLPAGASLEGYLYPDSFQKQSDTPVEVIIRESLDEMQAHLTKDVVDGFTAQGLNVYQGITLASIVAQESGDSTAQPTIAQVFLLRLRQDMVLGSDVTAYYASDVAGVPRTVNIDSPYNTHLNKGLPPGPISNVTETALAAVAHPSTTTYLYFVAGDDGKIHFS